MVKFSRLFKGSDCQNIPSWKSPFRINLVPRAYSLFLFWIVIGHFKFLTKRREEALGTRLLQNENYCYQSSQNLVFIAHNYTQITLLHENFEAVKFRGHSNFALLSPKIAFHGILISRFGQNLRISWLTLKCVFKI